MTIASEHSHLTQVSVSPQIKLSQHRRSMPSGNISHAVELSTSNPREEEAEMGIGVNESTAANHHLQMSGKKVIQPPNRIMRMQYEFNVAGTTTGSNKSSKTLS